MVTINLEFHRCPSAMTRARKFIAQFHASAETTGQLTTIEPALLRHVEAVLNSEYPNLTASVKDMNPIEPLMIEQWESDPLFDEDDLDRAENIIVIEITRGGC